MSETTNIAWADSTFNPWIGCTKVSPGCDHCYAEALMDKRYHKVAWGAGQPRQRTSDAYWRQSLAWNRKAAASGKPWRVFCASLADVFDNEVPGEWRNDLWELILTTPHLTWMLLTKRVGNVRAMLPWGDAAECPIPPNVWIGATVVNQEEADRDTPKLLRVPAAVRFLSIEPMLEAIDLRLRKVPAPFCRDCGDHDGVICPNDGKRCSSPNWVIIGGESDQPGHRARPFNIEWARDIVRQCKAAGVPVFVKQVGSRPDCSEKDATGHRIEGAVWVPTLICKDRAGADPAEWPVDLRVREFPR